MNDMRQVIIPKSDQLNADDLIGGPRTITITGVSIRPGTEQPVSIHFEGDGNKPWKPCKSMSRVLVSVWGPDAKAYVGRSVTLFLDPDVKWGGMAVGGIRISHMSDMGRESVLALTVTKGQRRPYTVKPLGLPSKEGLNAEADAAAASGMAAYRSFFEGLGKADQKALLPGHDGRKATALQVDISAARASLAACATEPELDAEWERLPIEICRELGAEVLEERRAAIRGVN